MPKKDNSVTGKFKSKRIDESVKTKSVFKQDVETMQDGIIDSIEAKSKGKQIMNVQVDDETNQEKEIQRDLAEVYADRDGHIPDMTTLDTGKKPIWFIIIYTLIGLLAVLLAVSIAGFVVFTNLVESDKFTNEQISLKIDPPLTLTSGEEAEYTIIINNQEQVNLYNAELQVFYPDNFVLTDTSPKAAGENSNTWKFSLLRTGETKKITFKGSIVGSINSVKSFNAALNFKPENLNATFKQEAIVDVMIGSSLIDLDIEGPDRILADQTAEYTLSYLNVGDETISNLQLVVEYPQGFVLESAEPESESDTNDTWEIVKLEPETRQEIKITGNYAATVKAQNQEFKARIQLQQGSDYYPQAEDSIVTRVIKDQLNLQLIINGSSEDQPIGFEDLLVYTLTYANAGQEELEDITLTANLDSEILNWSTLEDENKGQFANNQIIWDGKDVSQLLKLKPGEEGEISWKIRVKDASVVSDEQIAKFSVENTIQADFKVVDSDQVITVKTQPITNSINSDLSLIGLARYYDSDNIALGAGQYIPHVDEESEYNILLEITNNLHDIENVKVTATLPKGKVSWADKANHISGDLIYDQSNNKVIWQIANLSKSAGQTEASFNVSLTPTLEDAGKVLLLVSELTLIGKDKNTGADISQKLKAITTELDDPILGETSGIVE